MKDVKQTSITIRTTVELKDALIIMAQKENRTLSNMVEMLLERAAKSSGKKK